MNTLVRNHVNLLGLNHYRAGGYSKGTHFFLRPYKTKKYQVDGVHLKYFFGHSLSRPNTKFYSIPHIPAVCYDTQNIYNHDLSVFGITSSSRSLHFSTRLCNQPSSKVEVTVQTIKNKQKEKEEALKKEVVNTLAVDSKPSEPVKVEVKKSLKQRIWEEVLHYYHGFRLLVIDINICRKLLWRVLSGNKLTRREHRLLVRTTSDLFRLVPFSIFIIVPFMELLLPVFIKLFPGMLPSTFQTAKDKEDKLKQSLQVKLEVAKFLQKTLDEMAVQHKDHKSEEAKAFAIFFRKIKNPDEYINNDEIIKFSKQFEDEVTLDSLTRDQLTALCRILEMGTIGTNNFLRFQIRMKLRSLAADDRVIQREGVDALNMYELQQACKSRGMRAYGLPQDKLRLQLQEWIDLSLNEKVPPTLLVLSRALMVPDDTPTTDKLKVTISTLPDALATQTKAAIGEREGKIDNKTKIEIIKEEERKIKEEREEEREIEKEKREQAEILVDKAPIIDDIARVIVDMPKVEEGISSKDAEVLGEALETLSKGKKTLLVEKEVIKDLKEEIQEYKEDVEELHETATDIKDQVHETRAAKILFKKVSGMINHLDNVVTELEKEEKKIRQDIEETMEEKSELYAKKKDELLHIDELLGAIKQLRKVTDDSHLTTIQNALSKIDADQDGRIKVDDVLKVIETMGEENVKLNEKQFVELVDLLDKEEIIEAEDKIEKALAKSMKESKSQGSEQLFDTAPVLIDNAEELDAVDDKHILSKSKTLPKTPNCPDSAVLESANIKEAITPIQEKILSTKDISSPLPPPPLSPTTKINPKDKML